MAPFVIRYQYWYDDRMNNSKRLNSKKSRDKKVTVMLPIDLLNRALKASGEGITPTLRRGLEVVAAKDAYRDLLELKGKVDLKIDLAELRKDRDL